MTVNINPDEIIDELGGCGPYQMRMGIVVHIIKALICFSVTTMIAATQTPQIWYYDDDTHLSFNTTVISNHSQLLLKSCTTLNGTMCSKFIYEGISTIVSSFNLVCDKTYVPAAIMSIQIAGVLVGNLVSGQLADLFGRKRPFFTSFVILIISNIIGFVSINWYMLAVSRFFIGVGSGFFLTIQYNLLSEFTPSKWRAWIIGFPSWPIQGCLFALLAWLIQDWRNTMLMCGLTGAPCLFAWWAGLGLVTYGINFGIQALSGNIFLNIFLFSVANIPSNVLSMWLLNRIGRQKTSMLCYLVVALASFVVGIVQYIANGGIGMAWGSVQTMTVELYPTVIRNIGFGSLSVTGRVGAILGPQLVLMSTYIPGMLYFVCGGLATLCKCALFGLPETMNANLSDKIQDSEKKPRQNQDKRRHSV